LGARISILGVIGVGVDFCAVGIAVFDGVIWFVGLEETVCVLDELVLATERTRVGTGAHAAKESMKKIPKRILILTFASAVSNLPSYHFPICQLYKINIASPNEKKR
jgi:hypothetical protein